MVDENDGVGIGGISLRDAIAAAAVDETISFAPNLTSSGAATILLTHGQLAINKSLTINGPGSNLLTIDASGNDPTPGTKNGDGTRVFYILDDTFPSFSSVAINGLKLTGGDVGGGNDASGGAILSAENLSVANTVISGNATTVGGGGIFSIDGGLTVTNCTISGNLAKGGGGISISSGTASITSSSISNNTAKYGGGGIGSSFADNLVITGCTISNNSSLGTTDGGGGISCVGYKLTVVNSSITGNSAHGNGGIDARGTSFNDMVVSIANCVISNNPGRGIGLTNAKSTISGCVISNNPGGGGINCSFGDLTVMDSTISGNTGASAGGGISINGNGALFVQNCTISGNSCDGRGGGIFCLQQIGTSTVIHSTITGNTANADFDSYGSGGGVYFLNPFNGPLLALRNTIIAGNVTGASTRDDVIGGASARYSLVGADAGGAVSNVAGSQIGSAAAPVDPRLAPLADNGGPTFLDGSRLLTHALLLTSSAINTGDPAAVAGVGGIPQFDERGTPFGRVSGGRIDIGALESQPNPLLGDYNFNHAVDAADFVLWRKTSGSHTDLRADGSGNGSVDSPDYGFWRARFGNVGGAGVGSGDTVDESASLVSSDRPRIIAQTSNEPTTGTPLSYAFETPPAAPRSTASRLHQWTLDDPLFALAYADKTEELLGASAEIQSHHALDCSPWFAPTAIADGVGIAGHPTADELDLAFDVLDNRVN